MDDQSEPCEDQTEPRTGQIETFFSGPVRVDNVSIQRTGENLLVVVDGEEMVLLGGKASIMVDDSGTTRVDVFATYTATEVDILSAETGS